ncbi:MAG: hypothetical protein ABI205_02705 [Gemmatimonadaceae bacterium]
MSIRSAALLCGAAVVIAVSAALIALRSRPVSTWGFEYGARSAADSLDPETAWHDTLSGGINARGIPDYTTRSFSTGERALLLAAYGVDEPQWLYLSDSSESAILKYDSREKRCRGCYVDSYHVGFLSMRRPGESWEDFERRDRRMRRADFPPAATRIDTSLGDLIPAAQVAFRGLLDSARAAGFHVSVAETYRSPTRQALLFAEGQGRTYTATSMHSYGRAVDIIVGDGLVRRATTRAQWVRFRRFVLARGGRFRLLGQVGHTWDWPHVELATDNIGFPSIDAALAFAVRCTTDSARAHPPSAAALGGAERDPCVFVP